MDKMLMIETGGAYIVVDTIAVLIDKEFDESSTRIMLVSGDYVETTESREQIMAKIAEVMRLAHG